MRTPLLLLLGTVVTFVARAADPVAIRGFTAESARAERAWEAKMRDVPDPARMREHMRRLAARPHHVGTAAGRANAEWIRDQFRSYGWQAEIETFDVLFPTPVTRVVELVAPNRFRAKLQETTAARDPTT